MLDINTEDKSQRGVSATNNSIESPVVGAGICTAVKMLFGLPITHIVALLPIPASCEHITRGAAGGFSSA